MGGLHEMERRLLDALASGPPEPKAYTWPKDYSTASCWRCAGVVREGDRVCFTGPPNLVGDVPRQPAHERCERAAARRETA